MIIHWQKDRQFYIVRMYQDLVGDWIVSQSWGNPSFDHCAYRYTVTDSYFDARELVKKISKQTKANGFCQAPRQETQLGFDFMHMPIPTSAPTIPLQF